MLVFVLPLTFGNNCSSSPEKTKEEIILVFILILFSLHILVSLYYLQCPVTIFNQMKQRDNNKKNVVTCLWDLNILVFTWVVYINLQASWYFSLPTYQAFPLWVLKRTQNANKDWNSEPITFQFCVLHTVLHVTLVQIALLYLIYFFPC